MTAVGVRLGLSAPARKGGLNGLWRRAPAVQPYVNMGTANMGY